jgi:hypothetical protein
MPPPEYQKPKLQKHDLSETPKLWRLVQAVVPLADKQPQLLTQVLGLAYYAASLAIGMPMISGQIAPELATAPPADPFRVDHGTEILGDRQGRLAGINVCAGRALMLTQQCAYTAALAAVVDCRIGLGQKPLDKPCAGCVHSGQ